MVKADGWGWAIRKATVLKRAHYFIQGAALCNYGYAWAGNAGADLPFCQTCKSAARRKGLLA